MSFVLISVCSVYTSGFTIRAWVSRLLPRVNGIVPTAQSTWPEEKEGSKAGCIRGRTTLMTVKVVVDTRSSGSSCFDVLSTQCKVFFYFVAPSVYIQRFIEHMCHPCR